jgi:hypothetical protein
MILQNSFPPIFILLFFTFYFLSSFSFPLPFFFSFLSFFFPRVPTGVHLLSNTLSLSFTKAAGWLTAAGTARPEQRWRGQAEAEAAVGRLTAAETAWPEWR